MSLGGSFDPCSGVLTEETVKSCPLSTLQPLSISQLHSDAPLSSLRTFFPSSPSLPPKFLMRCDKDEAKDHLCVTRAMGDAGEHAAAG